MEFSREDLLPFVTFKTSRSGGKGGQNVNKVSSKAELNFDLEGTTLLTEQQKELIRSKLVNRIIAGGLIQIVTEEERSQLRNKERGLEKLAEILKKALYKPKLRKITKPKRSVIENRLGEKKMQAVKKINRSRNFFD